LLHFNNFLDYCTILSFLPFFHKIPLKICRSHTCYTMRMLMHVTYYILHAVNTMLFLTKCTTLLYIHTHTHLHTTNSIFFIISTLIHIILKGIRQLSTLTICIDFYFIYLCRGYEFHLIKLYTYIPLSYAVGYITYLFILNAYLRILLIMFYCVEHLNILLSICTLVSTNTLLIHLIDREVQTNSLTSLPCRI
jgi:hypothetical protein